MNEFEKKRLQDFAEMIKQEDWITHSKSIDELQNEVKLKLIHIGTAYLYKMKSEPKTFALRGVGRKMKDSEHFWKVQELRYGKAMLILRICKICSHGEIEVLPPNHRMVIK